jgi:hypothetical protein
MKGGLFMKNIPWTLFKKTGAIGYYLLAKKLDNSRK